jgi:hypothetical protein
LSPSRKVAIVHAGLLLLTLWPLAQIGLSLRWDVSPWKLAGFGMYATPRFSLVGMEVYGRRDASAPWEQLVRPSPALQRTAGAFLESHRWLRRLTPEGELVAAVRAEHPEWRDVRVVVSYPVLDRASARVRMKQDERVFAAAR